MLELGSGGGNNASHLKRHYTMTLVDLSKGMLAVSRKLNPEIEHIQGDMRAVRLNKTFDCVFIHDAIMYITSKDDLKKTIETAFIHCRKNGLILVMPDYFKEDFKPKTTHGGHDAGHKGLRYLEWNYDPDPTDSTFVVDFAFLLREEDGTVHTEYDRHVNGLFSHHEWQRILEDVGLRILFVPIELSEDDLCTHEVIIGFKE